MLRRVMRATFADVSALGIVMDGMNLQQENIKGVKQLGDIGCVQDCDHHPKPEYVLSCFDTDKIPRHRSDYIFAGDTKTEPIDGDSDARPGRRSHSDTCQNHL